MFCIKDQNGKFVNEELCYYDKKSKEFIYQPYDSIIGVNLYPNIEMAQAVVNRLNSISEKNNLGVIFSLFKQHKNNNDLLTELFEDREYARL
jgi:hypothetical protein